MMPEPTEITVAEDGTATHESWILVRAGRLSGTTTRLFDSEVGHQHWVRVAVSRCSRKRDLAHDWKHEEKLLVEFDMSMAQWGAFVSSFGQGTGVPATLSWFGGPVPGVADEVSRIAVSVKEVRESGKEAVAKVQAAHAALSEAFERGAGKKEMRGLLRDLDIAVQHAPANMAFTAKSLGEHVENVVTKARADVEAMVLDAQTSGAQITAGDVALLPESTS